MENLKQETGDSKLVNAHPVCQFSVSCFRFAVFHFLTS